MFFLITALGLIFGSFAGAASYRLVTQESLLTRSKCPKCNHALKAFELIPVFSYAFQKGKCRHCAQPISLRYPLIELLTAFSFSIVGYNVEGHINQVLLCLTTAALMVMIITDFEYYIIPDIIQFIIAILGIFYAFFNNYPLIELLFTPLFCYIIGIILQKGFKLFMKKDGLGTGDVKFFAVVGIFLKIEMLAGFFLISGIIGIFTALIWRLLSKGEEFPFGPALAVSLYLCLVFPKIVDIANFMI
ncbi:hypothetical protein NF27_BK00270 [Candidatus Jidaibacter acanthamoeba]|uniref:Prepilin peptidase n=1 Tax=Candidatus Jidaibacter acanthamoebae TaxID=86105 RepID=A0A0C1N159_9RICK|nr:A24 family peptidase [Candidatus Jidaibacter acanthamoeba]KIE06106.1 hypothetical protein NF27_BK00270 [Candidatus Jidaibacter acanthamoeba]